MVKKIRETTISLTSYLNSVKEGDISEDQDVQRRFCSDNAFVNGIAVTVATEDYLPPLILGEVSVGEGMYQSFIIDGNQRTAALMKLLYGNYRITSSVEDSEIEYQTKVLDENGNIKYKDDGSIVWEQKTFDIKGKTYSEFPPEIQRKFDNFQLRIVTHQNCTMQDLSKLVRRYNNHKSMNTSQKALTYLEAFARKVKLISLKNDFFKDTIRYSETECKKGTYERSVCECVMMVKYPNLWKANAKSMTSFLNDNAEIEDFELIDEYATRLNSICDDEFQDIFVLKNLPIWFRAFHIFTSYELEDERFVDFLNAFRKELHAKEVEAGLSFDIAEEDSHTKNTKVVNEKFYIIEKLMKDYFGEVTECEEEDDIKEEINCLEFLQKNVSGEIIEDDISFYEECLNDYIVEIPDNSKILESENHVSMVAICAYSYQVDEDLSEWLVDYVLRNDSYKRDQGKNFTYLKEDFDNFISKNKKATA